MPHLLLLLLLAAPAHAEGTVDVAKLAADTVDGYCSEGVSGDVQIAANALIPVGGAWAEVDEAWRSSQEPSLLYWRGRLAQCLEKEERAASDFAAFISAMDDDPAYVQQVEDARRRMRFLFAPTAVEAREGPPVAKVAGIGIGVALGATAGVLGGLAGWQDATARGAVNRYHSGELTTAQFPGVEQEARDAGAHANALTGVSLGLAAGAAAALVATLVLDSQRKAAQGRISVGPGGVEIRW